MVEQTRVRAERLTRAEVKKLTAVGAIIIRQMLAAAAGFALARTVVFDDYAPFGIALAAAAPAEYSIAAGIGAVLGYLIPVTGAGGFRYIAAAFAAAAIQWLAHGLFKPSRTAGFSAITTFVVIMSTGTLLLMVDGFTPTGMVMCAAEALLGGGAAYFFRKTLIAIGASRKVSMLTSQELTGVVISLSVLLMSVSSFTVASVSPARILAVIAILAAARYGHEKAGAIAGIAGGLTMALAGGGVEFVAGGFAFGGLMAGVFSPTGRLGCCVAFILANGITVLQASDNPAALILLYEVAAGCMIFIVLPQRMGLRVSEFFTPASDMPRVDGLRKTVVMRLKFASNALCDVSQTVEEVSQKLKRVSAPDFETVFIRTEQKACRSCALRIYCWETMRGDTLSALMETAKTIRKKGEADTNDLPPEFGSRCAHPAELTQTLLEEYTDYITRQAAEQRVSEVRGVVSEQFGGISQMLSDMADEFEEAERYDADMAERIDYALKNTGIIATDVGCRVDKYGRMTAEVRVEDIRSERVNKSILIREISVVCNRDFDVPCIANANGDMLITLSEKACLCVDFGAAQFTSGNNRLCGDAFDSFTDGRGRSIMMISDGMGSGGRAAVDGAMASGLMSRLIRAGFGFDCALNIVNSAMLYKSSDESLATLDISCIDLFTGYTEFLKAGAPATVVRRSGRVGTVEGASLPAGILRDVGFDKAGVTLSEGDVVVMMSDGAVCDGLDWIGVELEVWRNGSAQQLAEHLADYARRRRGDGKEDDITVIAAILEKGI